MDTIVRSYRVITSGSWRVKTSFATHGSVSAALPRPSLPHPPNKGCKNITGLSLAIIPHSSPAPIYAPLWRKAQRQWRVFRLIWFSRKSFSSSDFNILHKLCGELKQDQNSKMFLFCYGSFKKRCHNWLLSFSSGSVHSQSRWNSFKHSLRYKNTCRDTNDWNSLNSLVTSGEHIAGIFDPGFRLLITIFSPTAWEIRKRPPSTI